MEPRMNVSMGMKYVWPGKVIQVIDPQFFWIQFTTKEVLQQFERLQKEMQLFARKEWVSSNMENVEAGMSVLVNTGSVESPYLKRGQIARIMQNNTVDVFYVDYGNTELTTVDNICTYVPVQFKECAPQAIKCRLAGISPLVNSWTTRGIKTFQKLTSDCVLNVLILYCEHGCLEVALYPSGESNGRSVAHCLVTEEVAMLIDEQPIPEFLQDISTFLHQGYQNDTSPINGSPSSQSDDMKAGSSPKVGLTSPSAEKYIPPHQKNHTSASSSIGSLGASPTNNSGSLMKCPPSNPSASKAKEPVVDFFPFDNVSVYPPSPSSPMKSPSKVGGNSRQDHPQNGSYFTKSPSRHDQNNSSNGVRKTSGGRYSNNESYHRQPPPRHHADKHRFAANFDNLPAPVNTFEPDYLNTKPGIKSGFGPSNANNTSSSHDMMSADSNKQERSPNQSVSDTAFRGSPRPRLYIPNSNGNQAPFYPPQQPSVDTFRGHPPHGSRNSNLHHMALPNQPPGLVPPGFVQTHAPPHVNQAGQYFPQSGLPGQQNTGQPFTSSSPIKVPSHRGYDGRHNPHHYYDQQNPPDVRYNYESGVAGQNNVEFNTNQNFQVSPTSSRSPGKVSSQYTPNKYGNENPESPDSPAIAAFNLSDLEHTQSLSVEHFHQRSHQERLQALQEEAEDIAFETKEQADLVNIARFGAKFQPPDDDFTNSDPWGKPDIYDEIEANASVSSSYKDHEELRKSPIKKSLKKSPRKVKETSTPVKLGEIPADYVPDINFTDAIEEALEYGKTEGMDKAVVFLDDVVELLKKIDEERQLLDVLLLLLSKAIEEYNVFHVVVMDTINSLNGQFDVKDCLGKALKRKQELYLRIPAATKSYHADFARVMGLICNMVTDWNDNKSNILDGILVTVEKWIVFNRMGTQIGQVDKENIFLDCFIAFWDISGTFLIQHNQSFISRIKDEVRNKLLNERVARPIRERLIDIMLELFPTKLELVNMSTQTPRCTMIPSSCQVKPSTCDKETWISTDMLDEDSRNVDRDNMLSVEWSGSTYDDRSFYSANAPPPSYKPSSLNSSPSTMSEKINRSATLPKSEETRHSEFDDSDLSEHYEELAQSNSLVHDSQSDKSVVNDFQSDRAVSERENLSLKSDAEGVMSKTGAQTVGTSGESVKKGGARNDIPKLNGLQTVTEKKSSSGKSIVDWFDYEPPSQGAIKNATKLEAKRLEAKKILDSTSMEIIKSDVNLKNAPAVKTERGKKKTKKDKKSGNTEFVKMKLSNEKGNDDYHMNCEKTEQSHERSQKVLESNETSSAICGQIDRTAEHKDEKNIDWWGVGETRNDAIMPAREEKYVDNIFVDNGPDVIIEAELDQNMDRAEPGYNTDKGNVVEDVNLVEGNVKQSDKTKEHDFSDSSSEKEIGQNRILCGNTGDDYAFELEDDDDHWDSDNSEDLNVDDWIGLAKPAVDPDAKVPASDVAAVSTGTDSDVSSKGYDSQFPAVNVNENWKVKKEEEQSKPSPTRWTPGRRKCLNCHNEDHTTAECKEKFNLL